MTYKILSTRIVGETVFTEVEYEIEGQTLTIDVAHYAPDSQSAVLQGVINRAMSEHRRIQNIALAANVMAELSVSESPITIEV